MKTITLQMIKPIIEAEIANGGTVEEIAIRIKRKAYHEWAPCTDGRICFPSVEEIKREVTQWHQNR